MPTATISITASVDSALRKAFSEASVRLLPETQMSAIITGLENMGVKVSVEDGLLVLAQGETVMHTGKALRTLATKPEFKRFFVQEGQHPAQWSTEKKIEYLRTHSDEEYRTLIQSPVLESGIRTMDPNMSRKDYGQLTRSERMAFIREFGDDAVRRIFQKTK
jgi:hypothetical protein